MQLFSLAFTALQKRDEVSYRAFVDRSTQLDPYSAEFLPAQRLSLRVHASLGNASACRRVLDDLKKRRLVSFADYLPHWQLVAAQDQTPQVLQEMVKAPEPVTELEAFSVVSLLYKAGRVDESLQVSSQFIERFGNPLSLWLDHGNLLTESQRWSELKSLAMVVNQSDRCSHLWSTANYWEGPAELFLEETEIAEERFEEIANYPIISVATSMELVHRLRRLEQKKAARKVLDQLEAVLEDNPKYWLLRCQFGAADKDLEELVRGATKAYELDSDSLDNLNNYVAALLIQRKNPEQAISLGQKLMEAAEDSVIFRLTYIHALIQNERLIEAKAHLQALEGMKVATPDILADYRLALFELAYAEERYPEIMAVKDGLDMRFYMPEKVAWIEEVIFDARSRNGKNPLELSQG